MSFLHKLSQEDRRILRQVVKLVHMKYYPNEFCTDYEADKMISVMAPQTLEHYVKTGKDHDIVNR